MTDRIASTQEPPDHSRFEGMFGEVPSYSGAFRELLRQRGALDPEAAKVERAMEEAGCESGAAFYDLDLIDRACRDDETCPDSLCRGQVTPRGFVENHPEQVAAAAFDADGKVLVDFEAALFYVQLVDIRLMSALIRTGEASLEGELKDDPLGLLLDTCSDCGRDATGEARLRDVWSLVVAKSLRTPGEVGQALWTYAKQIAELMEADDEKQAERFIGDVRKALALVGHEDICNRGYPDPMPDPAQHEDRFEAMKADAMRLWLQRLIADPIGEAVRAAQDGREPEKAEPALLQTWYEVARIVGIDDEEDLIGRVRAEVEAIVGGLDPEKEERLRLDVDRAVELVRRERLFVEDEDDDEPAPDAGGDFPNAG